MSGNAYMFMKQHDTLPALTATLTDTDPDAVTPIVNLTTATSVKVIGKQGGAVVFSRSPNTVSALGVVTMAWQTGDTAATGSLKVEIEVTWPTGVQTFPANGYLTVHVVKDLG